MSITQTIRKYYRRFRGSTGLVGYDAATSLEQARTLALWERLEDAGLVRVRIEPDYDADLSFADDYRESERKALYELVNRDGVWGSIVEYRTDPEADEWEHGDSCWGHIGYRDPADPFENPYVIDGMAQTIDALRSALQSRCPLCRRAS